MLDLFVIVFELLREVLIFQIFHKISHTKDTGFTGHHDKLHFLIVFELLLEKESYQILTRKSVSSPLCL